MTSVGGRQRRDPSPQRDINLVQPCEGARPLTGVINAHLPLTDCANHTGGNCRVTGRRRRRRAVAHADLPERAASDGKKKKRKKKKRPRRDVSTRPLLTF